MTKGLFIVTAAVGLFACSSHQDKESDQTSLKSDSTVATASIPADTVEIWDSIASRPFLFENWRVSLDSVLMFLPSSVSLEREVRPSQYHDNANDSATRIRLGQSLIEYIKTPSVGYIEQAVVVDRDIQFQKNIRIGDSFENVSRKLLGVPKTKSSFRKVYINYGEATSTLIMEFSDNKLSKVIFWPYTG